MDPLDESLGDMVADLRKRAMKHRAARDDYQEKATILSDKRDRLQKKARTLSSQAQVHRQQRDDFNISAREAKLERDQWNAKVATMRERGGLGDISGAREQAENHHRNVMKMSAAGQAAHEKMRQLMEEADKLRQEAQVCHEQAQACRRAGNAEHEEYIRLIRRISELENDPY